MKVAIHHRENSFSKYWIEYCQTNKVSYKLVDCYQDNIILELKDCDILLWHWHHANYRDMLLARQLTQSLELAGKKVFPDSNTIYHFDDKVAQKYLFESVDAPFIKTSVFFDKKAALDWVKTANFPTVFKLKGGAGSINVKLVKTKAHASNLISRAFGSGFAPYSSTAILKEHIWRLKRDRSKSALFGVMKGLGRVFIPTEFQRFGAWEKGYVYFQEFIEKNDYDTRIVVIGERCFGIRRYTREGDFRASGSGKIAYEQNLIDKRCVEIAFDVTRKIKSQCAAYDFVFDKNNSPLIIEVSYAFTIDAYLVCPGYWDNDLKWHEGKFNPAFFMIEDILNKS